MLQVPPRLRNLPEKLIHKLRIFLYSPCPTCLPHTCPSLSIAVIAHTIIRVGTHNLRPHPAAARTRLDFSPQVVASRSLFWSCHHHWFTMDIHTRASSAFITWCSFPQPSCSQQLYSDVLDFADLQNSVILCSIYLVSDLTLTHVASWS